ncbi:MULTISPECIES: flagellar basal body P-ring formation chaperone FlgA [Salipiger]|uniref:Flagella basal body P-ring formation protein FlgA n=1 Tax=Salipiger bermudensis (strain DSM 26914 / JCM 13377 / KCTC 12554 / HTCC2601) TaxID=314265 RepID=Q0FMJ2_SALBH|nr:flagellar basal body P-ring formation chaperone FlgA [Salipiger bermudensis]EAU45406.1 flagellar basal-body P-ring formation protein FlgA [Salipiger bermudensis HTCC2601]
MLRRLATLLCALTLTALPALAETTQVLIEEQVRNTWGDTLPVEASLQIRFTAGPVDEAELISAFWMDKDTGSFLANAVTEDGITHRLQGLAVAKLSLPVPTRRLMPGEIVSAADIKIVDLPIARVGVFTLTDAEMLEGMQVRRMLAQGRPVMRQSVMEPLVIGRGDKVNILYDDGRLVVTAPGRALTDAHRGQDVRIVNLVSNNALTAVAREEGLVEVIR